MLKKVFIALALLVVIGGGFAYYMYSKPVASIENKKADFSLTSNDLVMAFDENEIAAGQEYNEKIIEVTGTVNEIQSDGPLNKIFLESDNPMSGVICEMEDGQDITSAKIGSEVKIKGRCTGFLSDVVLVQSSFVR